MVWLLSEPVSCAVEITAHSEGLTGETSSERGVPSRIEYNNIRSDWLSEPDEESVCPRREPDDLSQE